MTVADDIGNIAIKACVAAGVTILLIMVCVIADCVSKWRIRRRVKKQTQAAAAAAQAAFDKEEKEELVKNEEQQENETKKV